MTGRYTGTRGDSGWTPCWECKRQHDEHTGDPLSCPVTAAAEMAERVPNLEAAIGYEIEKRDGFERERDAYRAMLCDLLASAHPHPVEHPAMAAQWARARELLRDGRTTSAPRPALTADEVREAFRAGSLWWEGWTRSAHGQSREEAAAEYAATNSRRVAEKLAGRVVATDQRALDALPPAQRDELDRMAAGQEVPGHPVHLVGHEHAAIIDQALAYWDRDLSAPHAQIAEIRKLIGGGS